MINLRLLFGDEDDYDIYMENHDDRTDNYSDYCWIPTTIILNVDRMSYFLWIIKREKLLQSNHDKLNVD